MLSISAAELNCLSSMHLETLRFLSLLRRKKLYLSHHILLFAQIFDWVFRLIKGEIELRLSTFSLFINCYLCVISYFEILFVQFFKLWRK